MKKILAVILIYLLGISLANAKDGFYVGADLIYSHAKHKIKGTDNDFLTYYDYPAVGKIDKEAVGFGLNSGYKFNFDQLVLAPEIYFDQLNNKSHTYSYPLRLTLGSVYKSDSMTMNYRYGARLNLGYKFNQKFTGFINYGFSVVDYDVIWKSQEIYQEHYGSTDKSPIYGASLLYGFNDNWSMKLAYDYQTVTMRYVYKGYRSKAHLDVVKLGAVYNF